MIDLKNSESAAAFEILKKITVLPAVIKAFMVLCTEQLQKGLNMASKVNKSYDKLTEKIYQVCIFIVEISVLWRYVLKVFSLHHLLCNLLYNPYNVGLYQSKKVFVIDKFCFYMTLRNKK